LLGGLALLSAGCSPATQVVGTWDLDPNKAIPAEFFESNPLLGAFLAVGKPQFRATFAGEGGFSLQFEAGPAKFERKGTWRFVKLEGETLLLMVKEAGKTDENELRFRPVDKDHAEMTMEIDMPGGRKIRPSFAFVKQKPAS
jgi:hypothetical protein